MRRRAGCGSTDSERFRALEPPPRQRRQVEAMVSAQTSQVALFRSFASALAAGQIGEAEGLETQLVRHQERYGDLAGSVGFERCGNDAH